MIYFGAPEAREILALDRKAEIVNDELFDLWDCYRGGLPYSVIDGEVLSVGGAAEMELRRAAWNYLKKSKNWERDSPGFWRPSDRNERRQDLQP